MANRGPAVFPPLWVPGHFMPNEAMSDEELLQIAGLSDADMLGSLDPSDPGQLLRQHGLRPVPHLAPSFSPDLPLRPEDHEEFQSRLPEPDFVPEGVTDPIERERHRLAIQKRLARNHLVAKREGQWGGQAPGMVPGSAQMLLDWRGETDEPLPMNVQLSYTIDPPSTNVATQQKGIIGPNSVAFTPSATDDVSIYARVEWGSGRAQHLAICDFQAGAMVRITGSWVRVTALYLPTNLPQTAANAGGGGWPAQPNQLFGASPVTGPPVTASAMLGEGFPTFTTAAARFTRKFLVANGTQLSLDPIPPFASAFGYLTSSNGAPNLQFTLATNVAEAGTGLATFASVAPFAPDNAFPIPTGARFISVANNGATPVGVQLVYALML